MFGATGATGATGARGARGESGETTMKKSTETGGGEDFAALLEAFEKGQSGQGAKRPNLGDRVSARIVGFGETSAFVDLGGKAEGIVPLDQLTDEQGERTVAVGDTVTGVVAAMEDDVAVLRVRSGHGPAAPQELLQAHAAGIPVDGTVQAAVKGGVEVNVGGVRGFCPISQLDLRYVEDAAAFVGRKLAFRVTRCEPGRGKSLNLVLSRRALLEEEARARAEAARAALAVGRVVKGTVTSLTSYGAFVDLGGVEGLLHVSELGHGRVEHPREVLAIGEEVEVAVTRIEPPDAKGRERIALSRRSLAPDPWVVESAQLAPGTRRSGRVSRLETFGAFVELAPGVDGLLHLSELAAARGRELRHARDAAKVGETIDVIVQSVDAAARRISLTVAPPADEVDGAELARTTAPGRGFGALGDFLARAEKRRE